MMQIRYTLLVIIAGTLSMYCQTPSNAVHLWDGKNLDHWEFINKSGAAIHSVCQYDTGRVLAVEGTPLGYLATIDSFENYKLHVECRWAHGAAQNSNSGVLIHIASGPVDRGLWPICFQVQMKISRAGDILPMAGAKFAEPLSSAPDAKTPLRERRESDSERPLGEWNIVEIICSRDTLTCTVNGVMQNQVSQCMPQRGKIGIQLEGTPFELRNIWLTSRE
ncbi:MAG: DUF1080 domain-containing protein [Ignavibacteriae bacterium]|nr:MAG: DUF1080 domain-containing protein [Ignavibacteriota bacterium]